MTTAPRRAATTGGNMKLRQLAWLDIIMGAFLAVLYVAHGQHTIDGLVAVLLLIVGTYMLRGGA
jgi:hypothetical protein